MVGPDADGNFEKIIGPTAEQAQRFNHPEPRMSRRERKIERLQSQNTDESLKRHRKWMRKTIVIPAIAILATAGIAFAVFTAEATGNDTASPSAVVTGTSGTQAVTVTATANGKVGGGTSAPVLTPTVGTTPVSTDEDVVTASVTAASPFQISDVTATVLQGTGANAGYVLNAANGGAPAVGCEAAWYVVNTQDGVTPLSSTAASVGGFGSDVTLPVQEPASPTGLYIGSTVWLQDPTGSTPQNACSGVQPEIALAVS
jgi:cytoskeletal protein RodZ